MKITRRQLRQIIKEEISRVIQETHSLERVDYERWATEAGHITPAASSVMASYFLDQGLEDDHNIQKKLTAEFYMDHQDVMRAMARQRRDMMSGEELDPDLLKGAYVSSKEDREAMKGYIAKLKMKKKKIDSDGSGTLDPPELRAIADDLGEDEEERWENEN